MKKLYIRTMSRSYHNKEELIQWLSGLEDQNAIEAIKMVKGSFEQRHSLSEAEKEKLDAGLRSFTKGNLVNEEEVWYKINQRYSK